MALVQVDRVLEVTTTTGTGALTLAGAVTGYRTFGSVCADNDIAYYSVWAVDSFGTPTGAWETGLGTWATGGTLTRTTIIASSNGGSAVDFAAGTKRVALGGTATGMTVMPAGLVLGKASGTGLKVSAEAPAWGWRDLTADITVRGTGAADPTFAAYGATALRAYQFSATTLQEVFLVFHVPHDWVPGSDIFIHAHWSNAAATPNTGVVRWGFEYSFAKGFDQEAFPTPTIVYAQQASSATRYRHMVTETTAVTIATMEVDGLILMRAFRDAANAADTCTDAVFLHTVDIHYQSTNMSTAAKAPNFYV